MQPSIKVNLRLSFMSKGPLIKQNIVCQELAKSALLFFFALNISKPTENYAYFNFNT